MPAPGSSYNRPILPAPSNSEPQMHISHTLLPRPPRIGVSVACETRRRRKTRVQHPRLISLQRESTTMCEMPHKWNTMYLRLAFKGPRATTADQDLGGGTRG
ncbi:unnamed protein product [Fusarium venenatum]|uniref:Uncharacterized protein n=1 Tax=Fusarium venenatum TaxID=56646 RepID=A0A2L2T7Y2_9HYPO|nr:uncharacterized protein FVRRES_02371 [Fusarium venenatum]CEI65859.1 unnamed protein product [Fusarium venenatum]